MSSRALRPFILIPLLALAAAGQAVAADLTVAGFNVESGAANPRVIAEQIAPLRDIDLWGFSEVRNASEARILAEGAADGESGTFESVLGTTGADDRLLIVYNSDRLELIQTGEIHELNIGGRVRSPLWAQLRIKPAGPDFLFVVNHLYRGNTTGRHAQAEGLNQWASTRTLPVIATGDYNFDWHFQTGDTNHDRGFDLMTAGNVFEWVRPETLLPTNCSSHQSVLDFVFVSGAARDWEAEGEILFDHLSYCPDTTNTSDHRPVLARFEVEGAGPGPGPGPGTDDFARKKAEILDKIQDLEQELGALRALVEALSCEGS